MPRKCNADGYSRSSNDTEIMLLDEEKFGLKLVKAQESEIRKSFEKKETKN